MCTKFNRKLNKNNNKDHLTYKIIDIKIIFSEIKSGKPIAVMTISYTAQPKEQIMLLQFCGKNFPRKGLENMQV